MTDDEEEEFTSPVSALKTSRYGASVIRETETSLILSLPNRRKIEWIEVAKGVFSLAAVFGLLIIPFFFTPENMVWGILLSLAVLIPTLYHWLYLLIGKEELEIDDQCIQARYGIGIWKRQMNYPASSVHALRCTATTFQQRTQPFGPTKPYPSYVWVTKQDTRTSAIAFDDAGQTVSLLGWIEKPLAKHFLAMVKKRFPIY